jgi:AraC family transcriptional regulator
VTSEDRLRAFLGLLEDSLQERAVTGTQLAQRAYLSRFHFDRLVAGFLGEPPTTFRRRVLLERAAHRLVSSEQSVLEIALDADFTSPEAFTRAFTRAFGMSPTRFRRDAQRDYRLAAPSGIHFYPPGGLRLPATSRRTTMDVVDGMLDHHLVLVSEIIDRAGRLDSAVLDQPIEISVESIDSNPTLRSIMNRLVTQLEMWVTSLQGGTEMPPATETSPVGMSARLSVVAPKFRTLVMSPIVEGRGQETFVDLMCEPPRTFTYAGVLAHVLTFAAFRRTLAIGALESAGIDDLGSGDPMQFVGGVGADASEITRNRARDALG